MIRDLFVWVRAWLLAACHGLSKQQLENEWSVSLSLSRLCSRPGPVARCRPEPSSARGRHIGGQQRMVSTSAPRSHQGQALNKQGVSVRRPGSGDSSDFHFRRTMLSRGKTENMGPGETAVWEPSVVPRVGGRRQILRIWSGITTGGLMSYISISVFAALSGFWSDRSLWAAQHEREDWSHVAPGAGTSGGGCNLNTVLMIRTRPCSRYLTWIPELFIPVIQISFSHLTCCPQSKMIFLQNLSRILPHTTHYTKKRIVYSSVKLVISLWSSYFFIICNKRRVSYVKSFIE